MLGYALAILLGSFLLFQVQPMVGKYILPWFGGTPAVWTTCMLAFQAMLLAGYAYAHGIATWLRPSRQAVVHLTLLAGSLAFLPIVPSETWKPLGDPSPTWRILCLLVVTIGGPYVLLAATSPLLQSWFSRTCPGRAPYRLYALSNVGSLAALLSYPFLVEPALRLGVQAWTWSAGYGVFAVLCGYCAVGVARAATRAAQETPEAPRVAPSPRPGAIDQVLWLALSACGAVLLVATTNEMCQEVAVVPFLWVLPLAIYLVTFILCFDRENWYRRDWYGLMLVLAILGTCVVLYAAAGADLWIQVPTFAVTLFVGCMVCHGELVRLKPPPSHLTRFYLIIATGGALGGALVALVAPRVLLGFWEYHLGLSGCLLLWIVSVLRDPSVKLYHGRPLWDWIARAVASVVLGLYALVRPGGDVSALRNQEMRLYRGRPLWVWTSLAGLFLVLSAYLGVQAAFDVAGAQVRLRNFYGLLRVSQGWLDPDQPVEEERYVSLLHGRIKHGMQLVDPAKRDWPTSYYGQNTGVGLAVACHPRRRADEANGANGTNGMSIGVVGLGVGTMAAYGRPGDRIRFYEINPDVVRLSNKYFSYRRDSQAEVDVVLGDARISLERALEESRPERFDLLVVDAFTSDAIPIHLLTRECFAVYWKHLKPDGVLAVHVSNRHLELEPVVRGLAEDAGRRSVRIETNGDEARGIDAAEWVLVTSNAAFLAEPAIVKATTPPPAGHRKPILWTDDFSNLFEVLQ